MRTTLFTNKKMQPIWKSCGLVLQVLGISIASPALAEIVNINLLHLNDVYEISGINVEKGQPNFHSRLARVATLRQKLLKENPHTYTLLAGDMLSPSPFTDIKVDNSLTPIKGKQMIEVMNR